MEGEGTILLYKDIFQHLLRFIPGPCTHCLFCFWTLLLLMYVALIPSSNWLPGILSCREAMLSLSFTSCCIFRLFPIFHHNKQFRRHRSCPGSHQARVGELLSRHVSPSGIISFCGVHTFNFSGYFYWSSKGALMIYFSTRSLEKYNFLISSPMLGIVRIFYCRSLSRRKIVCFYGLNLLLVSLPRKCHQGGVRSKVRLVDWFLLSWVGDWVNLFSSLSSLES